MCQRHSTMVKSQPGMYALWRWLQPVPGCWAGGESPTMQSRDFCGGRLPWSGFLSYRQAWGSWEIPPPSLFSHPCAVPFEDPFTIPGFPINSFTYVKNKQNKAVCGPGVSYWYLDVIRLGACLRSIENLFDDVMVVCLKCSNAYLHLGWGSLLQI